MFSIHTQQRMRESSKKLSSGMDLLPEVFYQKRFFFHAQSTSPLLKHIFVTFYTIVIRMLIACFDICWIPHWNIALPREFLDCRYGNKKATWSVLSKTFLLPCSEYFPFTETYFCNLLHDRDTHVNCLF